MATTARGAMLPPPVQVSPNTWAWIGPYDGPSKLNNGFRMNLGFVVGRDAVAVIDTGYTREMAEEMVAAIARITPLPIRFAINTNSQPHRHMGNDVFRAAGASIVASREAAQRMSKEGRRVRPDHCGCARAAGHASRACAARSPGGCR
jgi:glyoxylase-like metal-dependent hydrolase (beta-lactamase superfamily II)